MEAEMKKHRLRIGFAVAMVVAVMVACSFSASTANIKDATMALDYDGNQPTTVFTGRDTFYCVAELANAPDDTKVKAAWTAVDVEGVAANTAVDEYELVTGSGTLHFELSNNNLWPRGKYKVDLYLNDELDQTLEFEVQ
jgi:hypothetical protein